MWGRQFNGSSPEFGDFQYKEFYHCELFEGNLTIAGRATNDTNDDHQFFMKINQTDGSIIENYLIRSTFIKPH